MSDRGKIGDNRPDKIRHGSEKRERGYEVKFRVTAAEKARINSDAEEKGLTIASLARARTLNDTPLRTVRRPRVEMEGLAKVLGLLGRYGSNVNQLVREAHVAGRVPTEHALQEVARQVQELRDELMRALGKRPA